MVSKRSLWLLAILAVFSLTACDRIAGRSFSISWVNETGVALTGVGAQFGKEKISCGQLVVRGESSYGVFHPPLPETISVYWTTPGGKAHTVSTKVRGQAPDRFDGTVRLHLKQDGTVSLSFQSIRLTGGKPEADIYIPGEPAQQRANRLSADEIFESVQKGDLDAVRASLDSGVDINAHRMGRGATAIEFAATTPHVEMVKMLLKRGAKPGDALIQAAGRGDPKMFEPLIAAGANINANSPSLGGTPLIVAIETRRDPAAMEASVRKLLDLGADVNACDGNGRTPIFAASHAANVDMLRLLIQRGGDVNRPMTGGLTPLACVREFRAPATQQKYAAVESMLIAAGASR